MNTYIQSLHIKNVGKFDSLDVEFNPHMNIIVGPNGYGKTSILRGICNSFTYFHLSEVRHRAGASYNMYYIENGVKHKTGVDGVVSVDQQYQNFNAEKWSLNREEGIENDSIVSVPSYHILAIGAYRYFNYLQIDGMKREQKKDERQKYYIHSNPSFIESTSMPNIKQWMVNRYFVTPMDWAVVEKANWKKLNEKLSSIAPDGTEFRFVRIERDLEPIFSLNGQECYLEELSSGYKSVISILFTIIDWIEGVNTGDNAFIDSAEGTVLIDEVDAHLHPTWQQTVINSLREIFPKIQFIVTTHSPHVVISAKEGEVILISEDTKVLDVKPSKQSFKLWQPQDVLSDLMNTRERATAEASALMEALDNSLASNNIESYDQQLEQLSSLLHPSDSILKYYRLSRNKITLNNDTDN